MLESEVFYLHESWNLDYNSIMDMPCSRRARMVRRKDDLERHIASKHKQEMSRIRAKKH